MKGKENELKQEENHSGWVWRLFGKQGKILASTIKDRIQNDGPEESLRRG